MLRLRSSSTIWDHAEQKTIDLTGRPLGTTTYRLAVPVTPQRFSQAGRRSVAGTLVG